MKIVAISDTHGSFPEIEPCDLLIIAGDICPMDGSFALRAHDSGAQRNWVIDVFAKWLEEQPAKDIVWIGGNHDFGVELSGMGKDARRHLPSHTHYLFDEAVEIQGKTIYGSPWCPNLRTWAFYASDRAWEHIAEDIPTDTDILVLHSPPRALKTISLCGGHPEWASPHIYKEIVKRIKPELCVFGHLHEGYGSEEIEGVQFVNAAHNNDDYEPVNPPIVIELGES